jgi:predicted ATP-grasp superfamily ATP-dependent carboligase
MKDETNRSASSFILHPSSLAKAAQSLLIVGASARAAAFSALRAGLCPVCADLFADTDLRACCPAERLVPGIYPRGFLNLQVLEQPGPCMYTGGLENHPDVVAGLAQRRPLWGNPAAVLRRIRSPFQVAEILQAAGIPCPAVRPGTATPGSEGKWLHKPLAGAGGRGLYLWNGVSPPLSGRQTFYWQEYVAGWSCGAVYVGDATRAELLGVTRQLVGTDWLHAGCFRYCGSIGPVSLGFKLQAAFERLGDALAAGFGLRGLFGVDCIVRDEVPWPVEVNPRYTASIEVLEYAIGTQALALHRRACEAEDFRSRLEDTETRRRGETEKELLSVSPCLRVSASSSEAPVVGKAILFARAPVLFPAEGLWSRSSQGHFETLPVFADIPAAGEPIAAGQPVLTFFCRAASESACLEMLQQIAGDLDCRLFNS